MMSSSKIIKLAEHGDTCFSEFSFRNIGASGIPPRLPEEGGGFLPMGLFQGSGAQESALEEEVDVGPPLLAITEADLDQKMNIAFNDGLKEGKELAERGLINVFRALRASSETIHNLRDKVFRESEDELIDLVMLVARKVVLREISQDRSILAGVIQNAIAGLSTREEITVRINPDDYLLVTSGRDELLHKELLSERLLLKPDPAVFSGFCLVDTAMGTIDANLDGQLEEIYRTLLEQRVTAASEEQ